MTDVGIILLLLGIGVAMLAVELFLPTHGILGVLGCLALVVAIGKTLWINQWLGLAMLLTCVISAPFVWSFAIQLWPKTPFGRRVLLPPVVSVPEPPAAHLGQVGRAMSELRPMGICEFAGTRVESIAELGMIEAGTQVQVVAMNDRRPVVRAV